MTVGSKDFDEQLILGYMLVPAVGRYLEKKQAVILGVVGMTTFIIAPVCLYYIGLFPSPQTTGAVVGLTFCGFMSGVLVAQLIAAVGSMLADIADEHDLQTRKRQEGIFLPLESIFSSSASNFPASLEVSASSASAASARSASGSTD